VYTKQLAILALGQEHVTSGNTLVLQSDWAKSSRLLSFVVHKSPDPLLVYIRSGNVSLQWTSCVETLHDV